MSVILRKAGRFIFQTFIALVSAVFISALIVQYVKVNIYPNYLWNIQHTPFWFIECGISALMLITLILCLILTLAHVQNFADQLRYYILDALGLAVVYCLGVPLTGNNIAKLFELNIYMLIIWSALSVVSLMFSRLYMCMRHLGYVTGASVLLLDLCYFRPRIYLLIPVVYDFIYIMFAFLLIILLSLVRDRTNKKKLQEQLFILCIFVITAALAVFQVDWLKYI